MKYMILIYSNPVSWEHPMFLNHVDSRAEERDARMSEFNALLTEIAESGELVDSAPLADPLNTKTVRVRDDVPATTDGPFLDSKEHLAGFFIVDCDSTERATEIAARFPDARYSAVEVRPIMDLSGLEM
ncbi:YciI family protein [Amycolatopsis suaedae]|uniref:YciI family protein n=1 Tax=Amycolatopsis suaedae TaxID=2510978 RepID=A0A4Q7J497_9PSEU|nr:YciI family protein [Amycolatopsis suaedae]RZQ61113.1 YciI family protein [Amycolatopsis suaedae]